MIDKPPPKRPRCERCDTKECDNRGKYIRMKDGCDRFTWLDPLLFPPTYNRAAPRIRTKRTIKISQPNMLFLVDHVFKMDAYHIQGRSTRAINFCMDKIRKAVKGVVIDVPKCPPYSARGKLAQVSMTFTPDNVKWLDEIIAHYDECGDRRSQSWVVI